MNQENQGGGENERRAEPRTLLDQYHSVQFRVKGMPLLYQFKIRDISAQGLCILVRQDSEILNHLAVGDVLEMEYQKMPPIDPAHPLRTRISHMTLQDMGRYQGHSLVGLALIDAAHDPNTESKNETDMTGDLP